MADLTFTDIRKSSVEDLSIANQLTEDIAYFFFYEVLRYVESASHVLDA